MRSKKPTTSNSKRPAAAPRFDVNIKVTPQGTPYVSIGTAALSQVRALELVNKALDKAYGAG